MAAFGSQKIGAVERFIYGLREDSPLVIPQVDPDAFSEDEVSKLLIFLEREGIRFIAIGGTLVDPVHLNMLIALAVKDHGMSLVTYPSESAALVDGIRDKTAIYWIRISNATNPYFLTDFSVMNSLFIKKRQMEPLPTDYVFDDRGSIGTAAWLARAWPVPRDKPQIALALAKAAEYSGSRFFVLAGGSGASLPPSNEMVRLIRKETGLFLIPTSGIRSCDVAKELFEAGADGIHVSKLLESKDNWPVLSKMIRAARNY